MEFILNYQPSQVCEIHMFNPRIQRDECFFLVFSILTLQLSLTIQFHTMEYFSYLK